MGLAVAMENRMRFRLLCYNERECTKRHSIQGGSNFTKFLIEFLGEVVGTRILDTNCHFKVCFGFDYAKKGCMTNGTMDENNGQCHLNHHVVLHRDVKQLRAGEIAAT